MENAVALFLLIIVVLVIGAVLVGYFGSLTGSTYNQVSPLETALKLAGVIQISSSPPVVNYIVPYYGELPKLNVSESVLVNVDVPNYTGELIILPLLVTSSYQPYVSSKGFASTSPDQVGYISVEGSYVKPISIQGQLVNLLSQSEEVEVNGQAYLIQNGETLNITYVTNSSLIPALWVLANISGELFRIAYTYFAPATYLNTPTVAVVQMSTTNVHRANYYVTLSTWFSIIPNNESEVVENVALEAKGISVPVLISLSPASPTSYELEVTSGNGQASTVPYKLYLNSYYFLTLEFQVSYSNNVLYVSPSYTIENSTWQYSGSAPKFTLQPGKLHLTAELGNESFYQLLITNGTSAPTNLFAVVSSSPFVNYANYIQSQSGIGVGVAYFYLITPSNLISQLTPTYTNIKGSPITLYVKDYAWAGA